MPGFRSLGEGEAVEFESRPSDKGMEAAFVCGPTGTDCHGSDRRPISRKKFRKIRCGIVLDLYGNMICMVVLVDLYGCLVDLFGNMIDL